MIVLLPISAPLSHPTTQTTKPTIVEGIKGAVVTTTVNHHQHYYHPHHPLRLRMNPYVG